MAAARVTFLCLGSPSVGKAGQETEDILCRYFSVLVQFRHITPLD